MPRTPLLVSAGTGLGRLHLDGGRASDAASVLRRTADVASSMVLGTVLEGAALSMLVLALVRAGKLPAAYATLMEVVAVCVRRLGWPVAHLLQGTGTSPPPPSHRSSGGGGGGVPHAPSTAGGAIAKGAVRLADKATRRCPMWLGEFGRAAVAVATLQRTATAPNATPAPPPPPATPVAHQGGASIAPPPAMMRTADSDVGSVASVAVGTVAAAQTVRLCLEVVQCAEGEPAEAAAAVLQAALRNVAASFPGSRSASETLLAFYSSITCT